MGGMKAANSTQGANTPSIVTSAGTIISANENRYSWSVQNVGQNPLFVRLGGTASTTVFHYVLKGGSADSDGLGGSIQQEGSSVFTGDISIAGTTPLVVAMEMGG